MPKSVCERERVDEKKSLKMKHSVCRQVALQHKLTFCAVHKVKWHLTYIIITPTSFAPSYLPPSLLWMSLKLFSLCVLDKHPLITGTQWHNKNNNIKNNTYSVYDISSQTVSNCKSFWAAFSSHIFLSSFVLCSFYTYIYICKLDLQFLAETILEFTVTDTA